METVTITKTEYNQLKKKAGTDNELLTKLIKGLEDVKHGRIKEWKGISKR